MMSNPIEKSIRSIRRSARTTVALFGLGRVCSIVLAVVLLLAFADFLIHFQDPGIRIICTLTVAGAFCATSIYYLYLSLRKQLRDIQIAQKIERRFPQFAERLTSAVEFLRQEEKDITAGSAALRRRVIAEAISELESLDLNEVVDRKPARRSLAVCGSLLLLLLVLFLASPGSMQTALARLANPLSTTTWPQRHNLYFKETPHRMALGQPFQVEVHDRNGTLPNTVRIHYRYHTDGVTSEAVETMQFVNGVMRAHIESVNRPFDYRAEGGDDQSMPWQTLEVVEPPRIESFQITLHPPAYTGWSPSKSEKRIRALVGTRIAISGTSTKQLTAASIKFDEDQELSARLSEDRYQFSIAPDDFLVKDSTLYWFSLQDSESLAGGSEDRWQLQAVRDTPPSVRIEQPDANLFVTSTATIPVRTFVKDDLAIHNVMLRYSRSDRSEEGEFKISLYAGPQKVVPNPEGSLTAKIDLSESRKIDYLWDLQELKLTPGVQISLLATATDYYPQEGQSPVARRITIITKDELEDRISRRQSLILDELARVVKMQKEARRQTTSIEIQLDQVGALSESDLDLLQADELNQRQITRTLTSKTDGIPAQIATLLAELRNNRVDNPDIERRMQTFSRVIDQLATDQLPVVRRELTTALKTAQNDDPAAENRQQIVSSLASAGQAQDEVIAALEQVLGDLSQWADYRQFAREIRNIRTEQDEVGNQTKELGKQTLTKSFRELTPEQQADLAKIAQRQGDLARELDRVLQSMDKMKRNLRAEDPLVTATLDDAISQARNSGISEQMRRSQENVEKNQVGQAVQNQQGIGKKLRELLDVLSNRRENELGRLVKKLRQAESELNELRKQQRGLRKKIKEAEQISDPEKKKQELQRLQRQQQQLAEKLNRMARKLKRLQADRAGRRVAQGAEKSGQSGQAISQGDTQTGDQQAKAAEKDLDEAQAELARARKQAERDLAEQQLADLADALKSLRDRQRSALDETLRLHAVEASKQKLSRAQQMSLRDLAREQANLRAETQERADKMSEAEVFYLALSSAANDMQTAIAALEKLQTGTAVQRPQRQALRRLEQVLQALASDADEKKNGDDNGGGGQTGGGQSGGQKMRNLSELKLLKILQEDLNRRTTEIQQQVSGKEPTADQQVELKRLGQEQGKLADMILQMLESGEETPVEEDNPDALPDIRDSDDDLDDLPMLDLQTPQ